MFLLAAIFSQFKGATTLRIFLKFFFLISKNVFKKKLKKFWVKFKIYNQFLQLNIINSHNIEVFK